MLIASLFALTLAAAEAPSAAPARDPDIPAGAPTDDFGFVAWCQGALTGHMELRPLVKAELDAMSPGPKDDDVQQEKAGRMYLDMYKRALAAAEKATTTNAQTNARAAYSRGYGTWTAARNANPRDKMWTYLNWELPGRCEVAAKRLEERSSLFGEALKSNSSAPAEASAAESTPAAQ